MSTNNNAELSTSTRLVLAFFIIATVIIAVLYAKTFALLFSTFDVKDPAVLGKEFRQSTILALVATVGTLYYVLKTTVARTFVTQSADELVKVTWPTLEEAKAHSNNTIIVTGIIAFILFVFDWVFAGLTHFLLQA